MKTQMPEVYVSQLITKEPKETWEKGWPYWICIKSNGKCMTGGTDGNVRYYMDLSHVMQGTDNTVKNYTLSEFSDTMGWGLEAAGALGGEDEFDIDT